MQDKKKRRSSSLARIDSVLAPPEPAADLDWPDSVSVAGEVSTPRTPGHPPGHPSVSADRNIRPSRVRAHARRQQMAALHQTDLEKLHGGRGGQEEGASKQQEAGQGFHHSVTAAFDEVGDTAGQKHGAAYQTYQGRLNTNLPQFNKYTRLVVLDVVVDMSIVGPCKYLFYLEDIFI